MKYQALFSLKDESKKLKCRLLQILFGSLKVKRRIFTKHQLNEIYLPAIHLPNKSSCQLVLSST